MDDIAPSACGGYLLEGERLFIVYNYLDIYGAEHYWVRARNGNFTDEED